MYKGIRVRHCTDIPKMVLETAHWNGLIKKIFTRGGSSQKISEDSKQIIYEVVIPKNVRGDHYINQHWSSSEEMINETFNAIVMMLPPNSLAELISEIFDVENLSSLYLVDIEWEEDISIIIGHPDIIISDAEGETFFLIELKIQSKKTNGKFSLQQHTKYSNLAQILRGNGKKVYTALLSPSSDPLTAIEPRERGWFDYENKFLTPNVGRILGKPSNVSNKNVIDYRTYIDYQNNNNKRYKFKFEIIPDGYVGFRYINFSEFHKSLMRVAPYLDEAFKMVESYSTG